MKVVIIIANAVSAIPAMFNLIPKLGRLKQIVDQQNLMEIS